MYIRATVLGMKLQHLIPVLLLAAIPAHAQKTSIVRCQVGYATYTTPDFLCDAMLEGFKVIRFGQYSVMSFGSCASIMAQTVQNDHRGNLNRICERMWSDNASRIGEDANGNRYRKW